MPVSKLREFLDRNQVKYVQISHSPAYTAQEIAATAHIPGKMMAKTVMVNIGDRLAMAVLPADRLIDLQTLRDLTGSDNVRLAREDEFKDRFPDCEPGAMPPFGNLYGLDVYVAEDLAQDEEIAFNAGSHTELIRMSYADFERLVQPRVASLTV